MELQQYFDTSSVPSTYTTYSAYGLFDIERTVYPSLKSNLSLFVAAYTRFSIISPVGSPPLFAKTKPCESTIPNFFGKTSAICVTIF